MVSRSECEARALIRALLRSDKEWSVDDFKLLTEVDERELPLLAADGSVASFLRREPWGLWRLVEEGVGFQTLLRWVDQGEINPANVASLLQAAFESDPRSAREAVRRMLEDGDECGTLLRRVIGMDGLWNGDYEKLPWL